MDEFEFEAMQMIDAACDTEAEAWREYVEEMRAEAYYEELMIARMQRGG